MVRVLFLPINSRIWVRILPTSHIFLIFYLHYHTTQLAGKAIAFIHFMISVIYERKAYSEPNLTKSGKQVAEEKTFMLTAEQARIANHKLVKGGRDMIKIVAFAGKMRLAQKYVESISRYDKNCGFFTKSIFLG